MTCGTIIRHSRERNHAENKRNADDSSRCLCGGRVQRDEITDEAGRHGARDGTISGASDAAALAAVRDDAPFHDVDEVPGSGYAAPAGGHCEATAAGAMGVHSVNAALMQSPALIPEQPEVLLTFQAVAALPLVGGIRPDRCCCAIPRLQVAPWFSRTLASWRRNRQSDATRAKAQGPMAGHLPGMPWHYDLHVWAWTPNPSGCLRNGTRRSAASKARQFPRSQPAARARPHRAREQVCRPFSRLPVADRSSVACGAQRMESHAPQELAMLRHLTLLALCAGVLAGAGCSDERRIPTDPGPPLAPTDRRRPDRRRL